METLKSAHFMAEKKYERFGVLPKLVFSSEEIERLKKNYLKLSRETHPDRNFSNKTDSESSEDLMSELNRDYETLIHAHGRVTHLIQEYKQKFVKSGLTVDVKKSIPSFAVEGLEMLEVAPSDPTRTAFSRQLETEVLKLVTRLAVLAKTLDSMGFEDSSNFADLRSRFLEFVTLFEEFSYARSLMDRLGLDTYPYEERFSIEFGGLS